LNYLFKWDGFDLSGNKVDKPVTATIGIYYIYQGYYGRSYDDFVNLFAKYGDLDTEVVMRTHLFKLKTFWITVQPPAHDPEAGSYLADGWTISNHHYLSTIDSAILTKGNGSKISSFDPEFKYNRIDTAAFLEPVKITAVSGPGEEGQGEDNPEFSSPSSIAMDAAGNIFIADTYNYQIKKIDTQGVLTTIAGNGNFGSGFTDPSVEQIVATDSPLYTPVAVCVDASGNVYFLDRDLEGDDGIVRKIDKNGMLSNVAGSNFYIGDDIGDNQIANSTLVSLSRPSGISVDDNCNLYIADSGHHRIRMVDPAGIITTIAGNGNSGYSGDNGRSMDAELNFPTGIEIDREGNVYIADYRNHVIRKIDPDGIIKTIAGTGFAGYAGDGGPATAAQLYHPYQIELDNERNLYIIDKTNQCLRKINTSGVIKTISGQGTIPYAGNDLSVDPQFLTGYSDLEINDSGMIFVVFSSQNLIAKLGPITPYLFLETENSNIYTEDNGLGYAIDDSGRHRKTIDLETGQTLREFHYTISPLKVLDSITDQFGSTTLIERDSSLIPKAIISPDGLRTELTIDTNNHLTKIIFPDGNFYNFDYSPDGLMELETDPAGNQFTHIFSDTGKIQEILDENGGHWLYNHQEQQDGVLTTVTTAEAHQRTYLDKTDAAGNYTSVITDETGSQTLFSESGMTAAKTTSCGTELEFEYGIDPKYKYKYLKTMTESTPAGLQRTTMTQKEYLEPSGESPSYVIRQSITTNGKTVTIDNDVFESQKTITSPEGRITTLLYNPATLVTESVSVPNLFNTSYEYDSKGRLISVDTNTRGVDYIYNTQGFLETFTDAKNHTTRYFYDEVGRVTQINRPDTTSLWFSYDNNGNMTVLTNPSSIDHGFGFNKVNLNNSYQTPLSGSYNYLYDKDRWLIRKLSPSGESINFIYNTARLSQVQTSEGNIDYTYFCGSKIESITKGSESISYGYDGKLITSEAFTGTLSQILTYTYNYDFNPASFTYAGGIVNYTFDNDGLLMGSGNFTITRNTLNGLPETVTGGNLNIARTFNGYGELDIQDYNINGQNLTTWDLTRDDNGKVTRKSETVNGTASEYTYTYDTMGRLLTVTKDNTFVEEYRYGSTGTRAYEMNTARGITGRILTYSDEDHLLTAGSSVYQYSVDGFLESKTTGSDITEYSYSSRGELLNVTLPDTTLIEYVHDPMGRRIAKKVNGIIAEKYLWQGLTRLLAVYDGSNNLVMRFEYADDRMPVAVLANGITYYLTYDQVGSLRLVADSSGNVVKQIEYDTFGNILSDTNPVFEIPFGFAGGLHDRHTDLVRFGYRDYDPETGRWTAKDPILFAGGDMDLYGYVLNDPVNLVDPTGEFVHILGGVAGGAVGGTMMGATFGVIKALATEQDVGSAALKGGLTGAAIGAVAGGLTMAGVPYIPMASQAFSEGFLYGLWGTKLPSALSLFGNILMSTEEAFGEEGSPCP